MTKETTLTNPFPKNPAPQPKRPQDPLQQLNERGNLILISILILASALILGIFIYSRTKTKPSFNVDKYTHLPTVPSSPSSPNAQNLKNYTSKNLKFSINLPTNFTLEEKFTSVFLKNNQGVITISSIGTNFKDIESYLDDLALKNHLQFIERSKIKLGNNEYVKVKIKDPNDISKISTIYYYYVEDTIFSLSTSTRSLYPTLDQIAQSFRYTP